MMHTPEKTMFDRRMILGLAMALLLPVAACTVQPLYGSPSASQASSVGRVAVAPVTTRDAQQVRNRLVYLLNGGSGDPSSAEFEARLTVSSRALSSLTVTGQGGDGESSAGKVRMTATLTLVQSADETVVASFTRSVESSFDRTTQQFANKRALIDAENRAAAEMADILRTLILAEIANR